MNIGTATYEAASLLNAWNHVPQPTYVTVLHVDETGRCYVSCQMRSDDDVRTWYDEMANRGAKLTTTESHDGDGSHFVILKVLFESPFANELRVEMSHITYTHSGAECPNRHESEELNPAGMAELNAAINGE